MDMNTMMLIGLIIILVRIAITIGIIYMIILAIRALYKYINSHDGSKESVMIQKSLGETLKTHRNSCNMTQEFVAEKLGVSRQAVSKWESGKSDPSTANLIALAKLYGVSVEDLLKNIQ